MCDESAEDDVEAEADGEEEETDEIVVFGAADGDETDAAAVEEATDAEDELAASELAALADAGLSTEEMPLELSVPDVPIQPHRQSDRATSNAVIRAFA